MIPRMAAWVAGAALVGVVLVAAGWGMLHAAQPSAQAVGRPAPDLVVSAFDGSSVRLSDLRGRPVVLNFWASWCVSCRQEDPALRSAALAHEGAVSFLGVDIHDSDAAARAYEASAPHRYPVGTVASGDPAAFGVTAPPETVFIDPGGVVAARFAGPLDEQVLARYLQLVGVG